MQQVATIVGATALALSACSGSTSAPAPALQPTAASDRSEPFGRVVSARDGSPIAGAVVALNPGTGEPGTIVTTDDEGAFYATPPGGMAAVTATANGFLAAFVPVSDAADRVIRLDPDGAGLQVNGVVVDPSGRRLARQTVRAMPLSNNVGDSYYARTDDNGRFGARLPAGSYFMTVWSPGFVSTEHRFVAEQTEPVTITAFPRAIADAPRPAPVIDWLRAASLQLERTPDWGADRIAKRLSRARVVGLGEATHGSHEIFAWKAALIRELVANHGFTTVILEAEWSRALALHRYVATGHGDAGEALAALGFWTLDTQELLGLIEWLRQHNADPANSQKVAIYGMDSQYPGTLALVLETLEQSDPQLLAEARRTLAPLADKASYRALSAAERAALRSYIAALEERMTAQRARYAAQLGEDRAQLSRRHLAALAQLEQFWRAGDSLLRLDMRDRAMAENVRWMVEHRPGSRAIVWAHNGHVSRTFSYARFPLGHHLAAWLGDDYLAVGFAFGAGGFRARDRRPDGNPDGVVNLELPPAPPHFLGTILAELGAALLFVDLRDSAGARREVEQWLAAPHKHRELGAVFAGEGYWEYHHVAPRFDALAFVRETTPARPTPTGVRGPGE